MMNAKVKIDVLTDRFDAADSGSYRVTSRKVVEPWIFRSNECDRPAREINVDRIRR